MNIRHLINLASTLTEQADGLPDGSRLLELRRNPEINRKEPALAALQRYAGRKDVFVSFTHDVGSITHKTGKGDYTVGALRGGASHNVTGAKIGINPVSEHETPIGIYGYPIDYVLDREMRVPFASSRPYIWVFQIAPGKKVLDVATYSTADLKRDIGRLSDHAHAGLINMALNKAKTAAPAAKLWNVTRTLAGCETEERLLAKPSEGADERQTEAYRQFLADHGLEDDRDAQDEFDAQYYDEYEHVSDEEVSAATPPRWSRLLRSLGYAGAVDLNGSGLIHENEPTQGVFFSKDAIKTIELIRNIDPGAPMDQHSIWGKSPRSLVAAIRNQQVSDDELYTCLHSHPSLITKIGMAAIPHTVATRLGDNAVALLANDFSGRVLSVLDLNDRQMIAVLRSEPRWARTLSVVSPGVAHYIETNIEQFVSIFNELPLPPATLEAIVERHPEYIDKFKLSYRMPQWFQQFVARKQSAHLDSEIWNPELAPEVYVSIARRTLGAKPSISGMQDVLRPCIRPGFYGRLPAMCAAYPNKFMAQALDGMSSHLLCSIPMVIRHEMGAGRPAIKTVLDSMPPP